MREGDAQFQDRLPFKDRKPDEIGHLGITPTAREDLPPRTVDPAALKTLEGIRAEYRLIFQSMPVPGLPDRVDVGRASLVQTEGPIWSQRTHIVQSPGWRPVYRKWMEHVPIAAGYRLTVCLIPVALTTSLSASLIAWRDEARAAASLLAALFDERLCQVELAEDVITEKAGPDDKARVLDTRLGVREFTPASRVRRADLSAVERLAQFDPSQDDPLYAAGRWYLRAAQSGPTPDAIVYLWIALEALSKPPWGTKLSKGQGKFSDVDWVERAVQSAGLDPVVIQPSVGRLAGLRAAIVHGGVESPPLLRDGYYALEALVRLLLKSRLGVAHAGWPLQPGVPNLRTPFRKLALMAHSLRKIVWREPDPDTDVASSTPRAGISS